MFTIGAKKWPGIAKLAEECGEVVQVCGKLIATDGRVEHWDGTNLRERLEDEIADVVAAVGLVVEFNDLDMDRITARSDAKRALFLEWRKR